MSVPMSLFAREKVTLQLKWTHAFQFAGYYAALEKGYYEEAGLDVEILEAGPGIDPVERVVWGDADFGVGTSSLLLSRHRNMPVVALAVIFQHSPQVLITRHDITENQLSGIAGRKVMIEPHADELFAMLKKEKISKEQLNIIEHSFDPNDLIEERVDAMSAYMTYETWFLDNAGFNYNIFTPRSSGIDFYGDNLFTSETMLKKNPETVKKFLNASLRGWRYALDNTDETIKLIRNKYSDILPVEFYQYEAFRMKELLQPQLIDVGYMNLDRWQHIADTYAELGLLPENFSLDGFIYKINYQDEINKIYRYLFISLGILSIVVMIAYYIFNINQKLKKASLKQREIEKHLRANESRLKFMFETTPAAIIVWKEGGVITDWNKQAEKLFGWKKSEVINESFIDFIMPEDIKSQWSNNVHELLEKNHLPESINDNLTKDGRTITCQWLNSWLPQIPEIPETSEISGAMSSQEAQGQSREMISLAIDITERKRLEKEVERLAFYDPLTNLANRRLLLDRLDHALALSKRHNYYGALLFLDLDNLKPINDTHGHKVGDVLILKTAERLKTSLRKTDTVSRYGGDEFVLVIDNIADQHDKALQEALAVADKIRGELAVPHDIDLATYPGIDLDDQPQLKSIQTTVSIGLTLFHGQFHNKEQLIQFADAAMYEAKNSGKNRIKIHHAEF